jgi:hypothetical protein
MEVSINFPKNVANLGVNFLKSFLEFAGPFVFSLLPRGENSEK